VRQYGAPRTSPRRFGDLTETRRRRVWDNPPRGRLPVQLAPPELPSVRVGDPVIVTLPDSTNRKGRISVVGAVAVSTSASADSSGDAADSETQSAVAVTIRVRRRIRGFLDQAQVQVAVTTEAHRRVLAVPTMALRALPGARYEVIVVDGASSRHVPVETGLFEEAVGLAEVAGPGLFEGLKVEVPRDTP